MPRSDWLESHLANEAARKTAALVDGRHYSAHAADVKAMRRAGDDDAAAGLLLRLIDAIEREAEFPMAGHCVVPPWYFQALGAIYRRQGMKEADAMLKQRHNLLQAKVETDGHRLLIQMRSAKPA